MPRVVWLLQRACRVSSAPPSSTWSVCWTSAGRWASTQVGLGLVLVAASVLCLCTVCMRRSCTKCVPEKAAWHQQLALTTTCGRCPAHRLLCLRLCLSFSTSPPAPPHLPPFFPGDADAYGTIADCYTDLDQFEQAAHFYDKYISAMNRDGPV